MADYDADEAGILWQEISKNNIRYYKGFMKTDFKAGDRIVMFVNNQKKPDEPFFIIRKDKKKEV